MNNGQKPIVNDVEPVPEELPSRQLNGARGDSLEDPSVIDAAKGPRRPFGRIVGISLLGVSLIAGILLAMHTANLNKQQAALNANQTAGSLQLKPQTIPLANLGLKSISPLSEASSTLTVNGDINITDSLVLDPTPTPTNAVAGQIYFDQQKNQLGYYNGSSFTYLQGGSGTKVTNFYTTNSTNVTNNNITNVTNTTGGTSSGVTAPAGTTGDIAMFTAANTLGNSLINETGTTLNVGGSTINIGEAGNPSDITVGTTNNNSTLALQGGTGGISILTGATTGTTSGSITIESGNSSTGNSGNVAIDTGANVPSGTLEENDDFETSTDNFGPGGGVSSAVQSNAEAHSGNDSLQITEASTGDCWVNQGGGGELLVTPGHLYAFTAWVRAASVGEFIYGQAYWVNGQAGITNWGSTTDTASGWTEISGTATAPAMNVGAANEGMTLEFSFPNGAVNRIQYVDDVTVTDDSSVTQPSVNIGATNAQAVTIGRTTQDGLTTINGGGGINLASGAGSTINIGTTNSNNVTIGNTAGTVTTLSSGVTQSISSSNETIQDTNGTSAFDENTSQDRLTLAGGDLIVSGVANPSAPSLATTTGGNLASGTYYYLLAALSANGKATSAISANPNSVATAANGVNNLSWTNVANNDGYVLYQSTNAGNTWLVQQLPKNTTSFSDTTNTSWLTCGGSNPPCANNLNYASEVTLQDGSPLVFDGLTGGNNALISYNPHNNYLVMGNYNVGGGVYNEGNYFDFRDTTGYHDDFLINNTGQTTFSNRTNSATAFQVQNSTGNTLFDVDTSGSAVNVGASGTDTINLGGVIGTMGFSSIGNVQDTGDVNLISGGQFTAPSTGTLGSMSAYIGANVEAAPNNKVQFALYADNGSNAPGAYIASTAVGTETASSWNTLPITASVTAGTKYWLVQWTTSNNPNDDAPVHTTLTSGQTHNYAYTTGVTFGSGTDNGMPATFPAPTSDNNTASFLSIYASYNAVSSPAITVDTSGTLTDNGAAVFKDANSSLTAFQIQNSSGGTIFTADTANGIITVTNFVATGTITVDGHIITGGNNPTIAAGVAACSTPTVSINGTDTAGTITVTTGTGCAASGSLATITFASAFAAAPHVSLTPGGSTALTLGVYVNDATTAASGFTIGTNATPANATTYQWNYQVLQ